MRWCNRLRQRRGVFFSLFQSGIPLRVEPLEGRRLLSTTATLDPVTHQLFIGGSDFAANDTIRVDATALQVIVSVDLGSGAPGTNPIVSSFNRGDVASIA